MTQEFKRFVDDVSKEGELSEELKAALDGVELKDRLEKAVEFANKKGYDIKAEDAYDDGQEIDMDELEAVVGGGGCGCAIAGYGGGDGLNCMCAVIGNGRVDDYPGISSQGGCVCAFAGTGATRRH